MKWCMYIAFAMVPGSIGTPTCKNETCAAADDTGVLLQAKISVDKTVQAEATVELESSTEAQFNQNEDWAEIKDYIEEAHNDTTPLARTWLPCTEHCIIRSTYPGKWKNAELAFSFYGDKAYPMANVDFRDYVEWNFEHISGDLYYIKSHYDDKWDDHYLAWDLVWESHPMASVERNERVKWKIERHGSVYKIINAVSGRWNGASLAWDGGTNPPQVSVEFHDPTFWEILKPFSITGKWEYVKQNNAHEGTTDGRSVTYGTKFDYGWSKTTTLTKSLTETMEAGFEVEGAGSAKATVSGTVAKEVAKTVKKAFSVTAGTKTTTSYKAGPNCNVLFNFQTTTTNNHYKYRNQKIVTMSEEFQATPFADNPPRCYPGFCGWANGCQLCKSSEWVIPNSKPPYITTKATVHIETSVSREFTIFTDDPNPILSVSKQKSTREKTYGSNYYVGRWENYAHGAKQFRDRPYRMHGAPEHLVNLRYYEGPCHSGVVSLEVVVSQGSNVYIAYTLFYSKHNMPVGISSTPGHYETKQYPAMTTESFVGYGFEIRHIKA